MPSMTETQGLVLAEALAAGALVIAADAPQNRDVLAGAGRIVRADGARPSRAAFARAEAATSSPGETRAGCAPALASSGKADRIELYTRGSFKPFGCLTTNICSV